MELRGLVLMLQMWAGGKPEDQNIKASVGIKGTENLVSEAKDVLCRLPILPIKKKLIGFFFKNNLVHSKVGKTV